MTTNWRELFPTRITFVIFICYICLFIGQGIFVTASQESNNGYSYNTVTVVLLTEVLKLIVSASLYCRVNNLKSLARDVCKESDLMLLYFIPSFLYCLYNNLAFVNLATFDPTTYYLLLQLRVVVTGLLFQIIFKKYLSKRQWISIILLTFGCMIKQININVTFNFMNSPIAADLHENATKILAHHAGEKNMKGFDLSLSAILILAQTIFSCLAGVYNEYLLKDRGVDVNIFVQNVFMYLDSIICNVVVLSIRGEILDSFRNLGPIFRFNVLIIIFNNAAIGIVTSFFLRYMNSILKTFASALELLVTAIMCYVIFAIPIYLNTALSIAVVSLAIYLYSQSPVVNKGKVRRIQSIHERSSHTEEKKPLKSDAEEQMFIV